MNSTSTSPVFTPAILRNITTSDITTKVDLPSIPELKPQPAFDFINNLTNITNFELSNNQEEKEEKTLSMLE